MASSSRKLPCSLTTDGRAWTLSEHLMPDPARKDPVFVGTRSGCRYSAGYICYVGDDVTAADIVAKANLPVSDELVSMLDEFLGQLSQFKIDNVVAVTWRDGRVALTKVADHTARESLKRPLP
jgi:hypothetical protein